MTKKLIGSAVLALLAMGCATPPATQVGFNPQTKAWTVSSPKQFSADEIKVELPDGAKFSATKLKSENDAAILGVLMQQNIAQGEQLLKAIQMLQSLANKGATGGLAP